MLYVVWCMYLHSVALCIRTGPEQPQRARQLPCNINTYLTGAAMCTPSLCRACAKDATQRAARLKPSLLHPPTLLPLLFGVRSRRSVCAFGGPIYNAAAVSRWCTTRMYTYRGVSLKQPRFLSPATASMHGHWNAKRITPTAYHSRNTFTYIHISPFTPHHTPHHITSQTGDCASSEAD